MLSCDYQHHCLIVGIGILLGEYGVSSKVAKVVKKIVLISGSNMLRDLVTRAINKEKDLEIDLEFHSQEDLDDREDLDADWILTLHPANVSPESNQKWIAKKPDVKWLNLATDGSQVTLRWLEKDVRKQVSLSDLIEILRNAD